jgi:TonB-linked SusC/RagA family outer membrane protein
MLVAGTAMSYAGPSLSGDNAEVAVVQQHAQKVTGVVLDSAGEPIIGASVVEAGTSNGTVTDYDGRFTLSVKPGAKITISYVGYVPQTIVQKTPGDLKIRLKENTEQLEEVVVTGYGGRQLRSKLTNSISKVNEEALTVGVHSNPAQALSGAVAGLRVTQTSGNPGSTPTLVLRGGTNFDGTGSPLVMVDGQLRGSLSDINPEDIESMEVLKDAGATAIYGARASNGVILITTKTGKEGKGQINLKASLGLNYLNKTHEFLGAADYLYWMRTAYNETAWAPKNYLTNASPAGTGNVYGSSMIWNVMKYSDDYAWLLDKGWKVMADPVNSAEQIMYKETDPADYNFNNPAITQDYNVSMSGGNANGSYYAGLGYNKQDGLPITSFYERYSFILNGSWKVTNWLKSTSNFNFTRANWNSMPGSLASEENYFGRILSVPKTARYEDEDGNPLLGPSFSDGNQSYQADKWWRDYQSDKFTMVQGLEATLMKGLTVKGTMNWYYSENVQEAFTRDYQTNQAGTAFSKTRSSSAYFNRDFDQTYNAVINYVTTINRNNNLNAMLGTEYYETKTKGFSASGSGAATDNFADLALTLTDANKRSIDSWHSLYKIMSYFGRVNYDYAGKYLLSAVFREDGYSSLLDNRWGFFPGVSAGWVFGQESFMRDAVPYLSFGKLRASYGINGNATGIGAYTLQGSYSPTTYAGSTGFLIGSLPNPSLRWEKTKTFEFGLDISFFNNRLNGNFTFYNRMTSDKYASFALPTTTGFSSVTNNNGKFRNRGVEMELSGTIFSTKDFTWEMKGNITYNKNKVIQLPNNAYERNRQGGSQIYTGRKVKDASGNLVDELKWVGGYQEGQEPGVVVGYVAKGIFQSDEEINAAYPGGMVTSGNYSGKIQYTPEKWATLTAAQQAAGILLKPGDMQWKDINGDGIIDSYDQEVLGNTIPHWTGGFTTTFRWKGLTFYGAFDFALGFTSYDNTTPWYLGAMQGTYNTTTEVFDTWTATNTNAKYPKYNYADLLGAANYYRTSTLFAYNGNYLAFRELALSYTLPQTWTQKFACQRLDISVTGQNLGYLKHGKVATPEVSRTGGVASGTGYPLPRTVLFGVNLTF